MEQKRETRSFLMPRDPSIDRRYRPRPQKRERLFCEIEEESYDLGESSDEDFEVRSIATEESTTEETGALVYLRLKPVENPSKSYTIAGNVLMNGPPTDSASSSKNKNCMEKHYVFSEIFDHEVSQKEVYEKCIGEKIKAEESFTVLTYGTSGSGKTFTLLGDDQYPGIIPRSLENIFTLYQTNLYPTPIMKLVNARVTVLDDATATSEQISSRHLIEQCKNLETNHMLLRQSIQNEHKFETLLLKNDVSVLIWVTFVEIYNECVYDLLAPNKTVGVGGVAGAGAINTRKNLKIVCNAGKVFIKGVTSVYVKSSLEALKLLRSGLQKLTYASTAINANSSRSHCVFFVDVLKYYRSGVITETSYKFCDLAGSERLDKTGNIGSRLKEAQRINTSLMVLGRCLDAANNMTTINSASSLIASKKERIPFRESKLTMILQAALQGKEKMAMIVNVTPTEKYYEENLNVLSFASIASNIIFKAPVLKQQQSRYSAFGTTPDNNYIQELLEENSRLKADIETLREQQNKQLEELIDENYDLKEEIQRLTYQHQEELLKQEQDLRNKLVDEYQKSREEHKKQFKLRLELEIERQKRSHMLELEQLKRRHQEELEDLREELNNDDDDEDDNDNDDDDDLNNPIDNIKDENPENKMFYHKNGDVIMETEDKENLQQNL